VHNEAHAWRQVCSSEPEARIQDNIRAEGKWLHKPLIPRRLKPQRSKPFRQVSGSALMPGLLVSAAGHGRRAEGIDRPAGAGKQGVRAGLRMQPGDEGAEYQKNSQAFLHMPVFAGRQLLRN
jgi:hypothetical protein